jgi:hypothetical protein
VELEDRLDRVGEVFNGRARTRSSGGQQDQSAVALAASQPLGGERTEVLDVVRDYSAPLYAGDVEDDPVAATDQIIAFGYCDDVVAALAQLPSDLRRKLLIE